MARNPKPVGRLFEDKPILRSLARQIHHHDSLLREVRQSLPGDLAQHCVSAQIRDATLILHTSSAAWATRLRYTAPQCLRLLKLAHPELCDVRVKLLLTRGKAPTAPRKLRKSARAAGIIQDSAADTQHPQLREALQRLARSLEPD